MYQPVDTNHPNKEVLTSYALQPETVEESLAQHIRQCVICMREVSEVTSLQRALIKKLSRFDCPSEDKLTAYALFELSPWECAELKDHLRNCPCCSEEVGVTQLASEVLPPPYLWQTANRFAATLLSKHALNLRFNMRESEDEGMPPQIFQTFVTDDIEVSLGRYEGERGTSLFTGRIHQKEAASSLTPLAARLLRVQENQPPELVDETLIGPDNFFELGPVSKGTFQLEVLFSDRLIEVGVLLL